jgi:ankyrin repeat protein
MLDVVKLILELNPTLDVNVCITQEGNDHRPLHTAARYNHGHIVKFLVSKGADMRRKELELGYTPILMAVIMGHSWAARELILLGCDLTAMGGEGRSALFILAEKVH